MSFPDDPRALTVGYAFGNRWDEDPTGLTYTQISPDPDDDQDPGPVLGRLRITRGRTGNNPTTDTTKIETALRDDDGMFSRRNPTSPYFGQLIEGTPMEVAVDIGAGPVVLARAAQQDWQPRWDGTNDDGSTINPRVPVQGLGVLARLSRDTVVKSALQRSIEADESFIAYWALGDGPIAESGALTAGAGGPFVAEDFGTGESVEPGTTVLAPWLGVGLRLSEDTVAQAIVASLGSPTRLVLDATFVWSPGSTTGDVISIGLLDRQTTAATPAITTQAWVAQFTNTGTGTADATLAAAFGGGLVFTDTAALSIDPGPHHVRLDLTQDGADIDAVMYVDGVNVNSGTLAASTIGGFALRYARLFHNASGSTTDGYAAFTDVALWVSTTPPSVTNMADASQGYAGETASTRIARVCADVAVPVDVAAGDSERLGPQPFATTLQILRDAELADHGVLSERRSGEVGYDPRISRYNPPVALALDYEGTNFGDGDVSDLIPHDDDRDLYNVVTVTRTGGSSVTAADTLGPAGTEAKGPRPIPVTLNLESDAQLADHAGWLLMHGTVDEPRYELVLDPYNIAALRSAVLTLDIGSRITIDGAPQQHVGGDQIDVIVEGETIDIGADVWLHRYWCEPASPFTSIGVYADPDDPGDSPSRYAHPGSTTAEALDTTETGVDVANDPPVDWGTADLPYDIGIGGEQMTVSGVSGTGATQTLTVTRSVNGVVKEHLLTGPAAVRRVQLWQVARYAWPVQSTGSAIHAGDVLYASTATGPNAGDVLDELGPYVADDLLYPPFGLWLDGTGDYASTPDTAALDITGDITLEAEVTADDYTPGGFDVVLGKYVGSGNQRSYYMGINTSGQIVMGWSSAGTGATELTIVSTVALTTVVGNAERIAFRVQFDVNNGAAGRTATYETAPSLDGPWTAFDSTTAAGTTSIFSGSAPLSAGAVDAGATAPFAGRIHRARVRSGLGDSGTIVADVRFLDEIPGTTSFVDETSRTWTLAGNAVIA